MITCTHPDCTAQILSAGLCRKHYNAQREARLANRPCTAEGCTGTQFCRGLCRKHYARARTGHRFDVPTTAPVAQPTRTRVTLFLSPDLVAQVEAKVGSGRTLPAAIRQLVSDALRG